MIISNTPKDYSHEQLEQLSEVIHAMNDYMQRTLGIIAKESKSMTACEDNVIYINRHIKTEYERLKSETTPMHEVISKYYDWHEEMLMLASKNVGQYHIMSVQQHIEEIIKICRTFGETMKALK